MRAGAALVALALLGCATVTSPYGQTRALGANSVARIYACPDVPAEGVRTVKVNEPASLESGFVDTLRKLFGADPKFPRKITETTEPAALAGCQLVQEAHGSAFFEPLAKPIIALGTLVGRAGVCILTLGFRCGS